jgi:hypothetical protein
MRVLILALLLAGCATKQTYWEKAGASQQDFYQDQGQCQAQAFGVTGMNTLQVAIVYSGCMRGKGWYQVER